MEWKVTMSAEAMCVVMLIIILISCCITKIKSKKNKLYFILGITSLIVAVSCDCLSLHLQDTFKNVRFYQYPEVVHFWISFLCFVAFLGIYLALLFFSYYIFNFLSEKNRSISRGYFMVSTVVTFITVIPLIVNTFTGIYYHYDIVQDSLLGKLVIDYNYGPAYIFSQLFPMINVILALIVTILARKELTINEFATFILYELSPLFIVALHLISSLSWTYIVPPFLTLVVYLNNYSGEVNSYRQDSINQKNKLLISQIQPHFMFNTLNSIEYLYDDNPEMGKKMINYFTRYLRTNLDNLSSDDLMPFTRELDHIKTFLEIEKIRFGARLNVVYDINDVNFDIPSLIIQPLVENAVKHGVCKKVEGGTVTIRTFSDSNNYYIHIIDDGVGFDTNVELGKGHVGLFNIKQRLANYFPHSNIEFYSVVGEGTKVEIKIPKGDYYGNISSR